MARAAETMTAGPFLHRAVGNSNSRPNHNTTIADANRSKDEQNIIATTLSKQQLNRIESN
jgi:hypothetical protein